jgi:hypothetical protein
MNAGETKRIRDFKKEHARRIKTKKRYVYEMDRNQAARFSDYLIKNNLTFSQWLKNHIESEI